MRVPSTGVHELASSVCYSLPFHHVNHLGLVIVASLICGHMLSRNILHVLKRMSELHELTVMPLLRNLLSDLSVLHS